MVKNQFRAILIRVNKGNFKYCFKTEWFVCILIISI